jgi:hypothetical protein
MLELDAEVVQFEQVRCFIGVGVFQCVLIPFAQEDESRLLAEALPASGWEVVPVEPNGKCAFGSVYEGWKHLHGDNDLKWPDVDAFIRDAASTYARNLKARIDNGEKG